MIERMPTCTCRRCEEYTECYAVIFVEQVGFDVETTMPLCDDCYDMYNQLYITALDHTGGDIGDDVSDDGIECVDDEDPIAPSCTVDAFGGGDPM